MREVKHSKGSRADQGISSRQKVRCALAIWPLSELSAVYLNALFAVLHFSPPSLFNDESSLTSTSIVRGRGDGLASVLVMGLPSITLSLSQPSYGIFLFGKQPSSPMRRMPGTSLRSWCSLGSRVMAWHGWRRLRSRPSTPSSPSHHLFYQAGAWAGVIW